jgi:hypothetical protein
VIASGSHLSPALSQRLEVIIVAVVVCALIFELVRRKRLMERYAILWLVAGAAVLVLGLWQGLLSTLAHAVGIYYAPSALFAVAFLFVLVLLVHFSLTVSRLADQNTTLAQRLALLQQRLDGGRAEAAAPRSATTVSPVDETTLQGEGLAPPGAEALKAAGTEGATSPPAARPPTAPG